jgi:hypothetical protein
MQRISTSARLQHRDTQLLSLYFPFPAASVDLLWKNRGQGLAYRST